MANATEPPPKAHENVSPDLIAKITEQVKREGSFHAHQAWSLVRHEDILLLTLDDSDGASESDRRCR